MPWTWRCAGAIDVETASAIPLLQRWLIVSSRRLLHARLALGKWHRVPWLNRLGRRSVELKLLPCVLLIYRLLMVWLLMLLLLLQEIMCQDAETKDAGQSCGKRWRTCRWICCVSGNWVASTRLFLFVGSEEASLSGFPPADPKALILFLPPSRTWSISTKFFTTLTASSVIWLTTELKMFMYTPVP